jgi:hypothetical protein
MTNDPRFRNAVQPMAMAEGNSRFAARRDDDEDDDRPRKSKRPADDDDDDEPPRKKTSRDNDDDDDDRPRKQKAKSGTSPLLIIGGIVAALMLLFCCGGGAIVAIVYSTGSNQVTVVNASRGADFGFGGLMGGVSPPQVMLSYKCNANFTRNQTIIAVAECGGRRAMMPLGSGMMPNASGQISWRANELAGQSGPITVWIEDNNKKVISNKLVVP